MPTNLSEMNLEDTILAYLRDKQGYEEGTTNDYVKDYALDTERVKDSCFLRRRRKWRIPPAFPMHFLKGSSLRSWQSNWRIVV